MEMTYTPLERLLHRVAFATPDVQRLAADVEASLFDRRAADFEPRPPLFVAGLPRAGTTALLEALNAFDEIATHTYRDMPFVAAPMLWARLSAAFKKPATLKERAHGDGLLIGYDSPEAFEEILWRLVRPQKYRGSRLALWGADDADDAARAFLAAHFRRIVALRAAGVANARYASKNNGNLARLDLLPRLFAGADVVVPVRDPLEQATSLWRQHQRFTARHAEAPFVATYMADLGHYEFGAVHRPIAFADEPDDGPGGAAGAGPETLDYWLRYWLAAYGHVAARRAGLHLVDYERWCAAPGAVLGALAEAVGLARGAGFERAVASVRRPPPARGDPCGVEGDLLDRARSLHRDLVGR
jgi:hypothetical protein